MVQLKTYTNATIPKGYAQQILDFVRIHWYDIYKDSLTPAAGSPNLDPVFHVLVEEEALYSSATVVRKRIEHAGESFMCYGLSAVMTYPYWRKRGYGRQVVDAATASIRAAPDADIAWLQTEPKLEGFYNQAGWTHLPKLHTLSGDPAQPQDEGSFAMMLFVSDLGVRHRPDFEAAQLYLGEYLW